MCRATTAAPFYFEPQQIGDEEFCDGGAGVNNPTIEALDEMRRLHRNCLKTVVSLGTGKPARSSMFGRRARRLQRLDVGPAFAHAYRLFKSAKAALTDCERTHAQVEGRRQDVRGSDAEFGYYRLNINEGLGKVELNEMKTSRDDGNGGKCTTIQYIRNCTHAELAKPEVQAQLTELAKILVRQRRDRIRDDPDQWERFACCTFYRCCENDCGARPATFALKREMREHLFSVHHYTQDILDAKVTTCRKEPKFHTGPF